MNQNNTINKIRKVDVKHINDVRLEGWKKKMEETHSTAFLLVSVGHDDVSGQLHLIITEDAKLMEVKAVLKGIIKQIDNFSKNSNISKI